MAKTKWMVMKKVSEREDKKKSQSKKFKRIGKNLIIKNKDGINMEESPILIKCHGCERNIKRNKDNNECLIYLENDSKDIKDARFNERIELLDSLIDAEIEFIEILKNSIYCEKEEDQHNENGVKDVISSKTRPTNFEVNETRDENQLSHDHNNDQYFEMDDYEETGYYLLQLIIEKCYLGQLTLEQSYIDKIILKEKVIQKSEWCLCCNIGSLVRSSSVNEFDIQQLKKLLNKYRIYNVRKEVQCFSKELDATAITMRKRVFRYDNSLKIGFVLVVAILSMT
ncbi:hypothetical protein GLOIN_2v1824527 [Rhizophagus irregularis DAOM 181602=DAOM 197198]|nr:hypothetical protein GLOIN_2v1824527 [Rhizophagus irregularis DAOM 181602=DAOM 197198]